MPKPSSKTSELKPIPKFASEDEAAAFWNSHDSSEYIDWDKAVVHTEHSPTQAISIRFPVAVLNELKHLASQRDVAYQSLIKMYVADRIDAELGRGQFAASKAKAVRQAKPIRPIDPARAPTARKKRKAG
jgi:predicted DNA binding CopG/RHH family protein